jgi:hypothetical protein
MAPMQGSHDRRGQPQCPNLMLLGAGLRQLGETG